MVNGGGTKKQVFVAYSYKEYPKADFRKIFTEIEQEYDWFQVLVSRDGGRSWEIVGGPFRFFRRDHGIAIHLVAAIVDF